jgi:hypothetical protein
MAESDFDIRRDELERDNLQRAIAEVKATLVNAKAGTRGILQNFLENANGRIGALDKKIKESQERRESQAREQAAIVELAQKETALNARERETYSGFLKEDFFTKKDFGHLEQFYGSAWDRLSESGKDQMSHRIWEGVRRDEYKFSELPKTVREKEMERAYGRLHGSAIGAGVATEIPDKDRQDFSRAYEAGKKDEAAKVLERESFKKAMFPESAAKGVKSAAVEIGRENDAKTTVEKTAAGPAPASSAKQTATGGGKANLDLSGVNLDGLKLAATDAPGSSADIPRGAPVTVKGVPSLSSS